MNVHFLHIFFIGPLLMYIALVKPQNAIVYNVLSGLGLLVLVKFAYLLATQAISQRSVWYILHVVLFAFVAMYVGFKQNKTPQIGYSLLLATGVSAFGYHTIRQLGFK
jgi:hypothetical protein